MAGRAGQGRSASTSTATGAQALIAQVGDRQQRLLRELEKLALEHGQGATIGADEVEESCATSAERKVWTLADALVAGDRKTSIALLLELRQQGERITGLIYSMVGQLRDGVAGGRGARRRPVARPGQEAAADAAVGGGQDRHGRVEKRDAEALRRALAAIADLEVETPRRRAQRGHRSGPRRAHRHPLKRRRVTPAAQRGVACGRPARSAV